MWPLNVLSDALIKKSTLTLLNDIKAALYIFISHYSERASLLGSNTFIPFRNNFISRADIKKECTYLKRRTCSQTCFHSSLRLSSGRSSSSSPIIRAASSSAWWVPAISDNADPDNTPDYSPAAPDASTTPCRRTVLSDALWSHVWLTPRQTSGMSCHV